MRGDVPLRQTHPAYSSAARGDANKKKTRFLLGVFARRERKPGLPFTDGSKYNGGPHSPERENGRLTREVRGRAGSGLR